jgi:hypothetical protein
MRVFVVVALLYFALCFSASALGKSRGIYNDIGLAGMNARLSLDGSGCLRVEEEFLIKINNETSFLQKYFRRRILVGARRGLFNDGINSVQLSKENKDYPFEIALHEEARSSKWMTITWPVPPELGMHTFELRYTVLSAVKVDIIWAAEEYRLYFKIQPELQLLSELPQNQTTTSSSQRDDTSHRLPQEETTLRVETLTLTIRIDPRFEILRQRNGTPTITALRNNWVLRSVFDRGVWADPAVNISLINKHEVQIHAHLCAIESANNSSLCFTRTHLSSIEVLLRFTGPLSASIVKPKWQVYNEFALALSFISICVGVVALIIPIILFLNQRKIVYFHTVKLLQVDPSVVTLKFNQSTPRDSADGTEDANIHSEVNAMSVSKSKGVVSRMKENNITNELPPAFVGTLCNNRVTLNEVFATLIDLCRRGFIVIEHSGHSLHRPSHRSSRSASPSTSQHSRQHRRREYRNKSTTLSLSQHGGRSSRRNAHVYLRRIIQPPDSALNSYEKFLLEVIFNRPINTSDIIAAADSSLLPLDNVDTVDSADNSNSAVDNTAAVTSIPFTISTSTSTSTSTSPLSSSRSNVSSSDNSSIAEVRNFVSIRRLKRRLAPVLPEFNNLIYREMEKCGLVTHPESIGLTYNVISGLVLSSAFVIYYALDTFFHDDIITLPFLFGSLVVASLLIFLLKDYVLIHTKQGARFWKRAVAFKYTMEEFISTEHIQKPTTQLYFKCFFGELLPYAIALKIEDKWIKGWEAIQRLSKEINENDSPSVLSASSSSLLSSSSPSPVSSSSHYYYYYPHWYLYSGRCKSNHADESSVSSATGTFPSFWTQFNNFETAFKIAFSQDTLTKRILTKIRSILCGE